MSEDIGSKHPEEQAYRRRFKQKDRQDDYALDLFRELRGRLADHARVDRILLELGRLYNPLVDGPIVDLPTRRRVMEALQAGRLDDAAAAIEERRRLYVPLDVDPPAGAAC